MEFKGVHLRVDHSAKNKKKNKQKNTVFVGNLSYDVEEESLRKHFEVCGNIENVRLIRDRKTRKGKGVGYVSFEDPSSVMIALRLNGQKFQDRELRVEKSVKKKKEVPQATKKATTKPTINRQKTKEEKVKSKNQMQTKKNFIANSLQSGKPNSEEKVKSKKQMRTKKKFIANSLQSGKPNRKQDVRPRKPKSIKKK